jgi:hypothetical protein
MGIEVARVDPPEDDPARETWFREGLEPGDRHLRGAGAVREAPGSPYWLAWAFMAEEISGGPLLSEVYSAVQDALEAVPGVAKAVADFDDQGLWVVWGTPSGEHLVSAMAAAVDELAPRVRQILEQGPGGGRGGTAPAGRAAETGRRRGQCGLVMRLVLRVLGLPS